MSGHGEIGSVKATPAVFLLVTTILSLVGLCVAGRFDVESLGLALLMVLGVFAGLLVVPLLRRAVSRFATRTVFLWVSGTATAIFIVR
jgi:hypothetical protein